MKKVMGTKLVTHLLFSDQHLVDGRCKQFNNNGGGLDDNAVIEMGSVVGGERVKSARLSGQLFYTASESFTLQQATLGVTKISAKDENLGGMADVKTNLNGDIKTIDYEVNSDIDESDSSYDGNDATAAAATYHLSIPSSTSSVKFSATVNANSLGSLSKSE